MSSSTVPTELLPVLFLADEDATFGAIAFIIDDLFAATEDLTDAEGSTADILVQRGILENAFSASSAGNCVTNSDSNVVADDDYFVSTTQQSYEFAQVSRVYDSFARALKLASTF